MKKTYLVPFVLIGSIAASGAAFAANQAKGEIKTLNPAKHELILGDGHSFIVAKKVDLQKFKVGQTVNVTYQEKNGKSTASAVAIVD